MTVLLTGAAGFIGFHVAQALLARGQTVIGVDSFTPYYDLRLKEQRLAQLSNEKNFRFFKADIAEAGALEDALISGAGGMGSVDGIIHLAAQAGVRYSIDNPLAYEHSNILGHLRVLELARRMPRLEHMIYASSSSVYGGNKKLPFSETDAVDHPVSLYAATKKANELMSHTYAHLYGIPQTGLRFFTVYGTWGRPDMAYWLFTDAVIHGKPIQIFNKGDMSRDFTHINDVVPAIMLLLDRAPDSVISAPHRVYNVGNNNPEPLMQLVELIEKATGKKANKEFLPMQPGDVRETYADIAALKAAIGFTPRIKLEEGIFEFVSWYRDYHKV